MRGPLLLEKKQCQKIRLENSGPKFWRPKFVSQNSALNSGSGGANPLCRLLSLTIFGPCGSCCTRFCLASPQTRIARSQACYTWRYWAGELQGDAAHTLRSELLPPHISQIPCATLAAQCEIPPLYRAMPFRGSIAEGVSHAFSLFS